MREAIPWFNLSLIKKGREFNLKRKRCVVCQCRQTDSQECRNFNLNTVDSTKGKLNMKRKKILIAVKLSGSSARQAEQNYYFRKTTSNSRAEWRPLVCLWIEVYLNQTPFPVLSKHNSLLISKTSCSLSHCCNFALY